MTQAEDANLQFFIFHRTSDYSRHEPFARGCSTLGRRLHSALASSRSGRHRLTFASSGGRCATKAARLASASRRKTAVGKQPYEIALADRRLMTLADLWETWRSAAGERIRSFTIVTTTPNEFVRGASRPHARGAATRRMAIVARRTAGGLPQLKALLAPALPMR
jgi:hypothetical protein